MAKFDFRSMDAGLAALAGPIRVSLSRRMLVAATKEVELEAKVRALQNPKPRGVYNPVGSSAHSDEPGTLSNAIYGAFDRKNSTETFFQYNVSWNNTKAWWGRLKEFGWWQTNVILFDEKTGQFSTLKGRKLKEPIKHKAEPFLAPAYDTKLPVIFSTMTAVANIELPKLIAEHANVS